MAEYRIERDSMGEMKVPADRYWGAQTQRSFENFKIGVEKMPGEIIRAFAVLKKGAALANRRLGRLDEKRCGAICTVCDEILTGKLDELSLPAVLTIDGSDQSIARTIVNSSRDKDAAILTLDSMQSVTDADIEAGASYLSIMEQNRAVLEQALS